MSVTVNFHTAEAFDKLKARLIERKCKLVNWQRPHSLTVIQGSIAGVSPQTCQKTVTYTLTSKETHTEITTKATLTRAYLWFTFAGFLFSLVLLAICGWIALDLQVLDGQGLWSWLVTVNGQFNAHMAQVFVSVTTAYMMLLVSSIVLETWIIIRVRRGIGTFAQNLLQALTEF